MTTSMVRTAVLAAAVFGAGAALCSGQTVSVARGTPGSTVEVSLNGNKVGSATVDSTGVATVKVDLASRGGKQEMDVRVAVESCGDQLRVQLAESGAQPAPSPECAHTDITGVYVMRKETSFVVDVAGSTPTVWLRQGPAPESWLHPDLYAGSEERNWIVPNGLIVGAAAGFDRFSDITTVACGDANCNTSGKRTLQANATFWASPYLGVDVGFIKPADVVASGSGTGYRFTTTLQTTLVTIGGKVGAPAGPVRVYGMGGAAYHRAASTTTQTNDPSTVTVDSVTRTIPGGTQTVGVNAPAWGWFAGGGLEGWMKPWLGLYAEGAFAPIKGADNRGGEGRIDDHLLYIVGGVRVHIFR